MELPKDIIILIDSYLRPIDKLAFGLSCKYIYNFTCKGKKFKLPPLKIYDITSFEYFKWGVSLKMPFIPQILQTNNIQIADYIFNHLLLTWREKVLNLDIITSDINVFMLAEKEGCKTTYATAYHAVATGNMEILKILKDKNLLKHKELCELAATNNNLPVLKYLHENGCPWGANTFAKAALHGNLEMLEYLRGGRCPWNTTTTSNAALNGHLNALQFLHTNGCPWNYQTTTNAYKNGHIECYRYAVDRGCKCVVIANNIFNQLLDLITNKY